MPYQKTKEGRLVNEVTLGDGYPLSNDKQPLKVGGEASIINVSSPTPDGSVDGEVEIKGKLKAKDTVIQGNFNATSTESPAQFGFHSRDNKSVRLDLRASANQNSQLRLQNIQGYWDLKREYSTTTLQFTDGTNTPLILDGDNVQFTNLTDGSITIDSFVDEDDMSSNSATKVPTQQSVKAYVDASAGGLSTEQVQDIVGAMFTSNTETRISATYEDGDGTIDLVVDDMTTDTNTNQLTVWNYQIDSGSTVDVAHGQTLQLSSGNGIELQEDAAREFTIQAVNASASAKGVVELATTAETTTGTDATRAVTPDGLKDSGYMGFQFRQLINGGFNYGSSGGTKVFLPMTGYIFETTTLSARNEFNAYVAPYDGYLNQVVFRSEEACGSTSVGFHKSSTGTEVPSSIVAESVTVDMAADDTAYKFAFSGGMSGSGNQFSAGDILAISFLPTNDANDVVFTAEFILDSSSGL